MGVSTADNDVFGGINVQTAVTNVLGKFGVANTETLAIILNAVYGNQWKVPNYRFLAYFLSDAKKETLTITLFCHSPSIKMKRRKD